MQTAGGFAEVNISEECFEAENTQNEAQCEWTIIDGVWGWPFGVSVY